MESYMKWNCFDLAEQMEVFERCKREFRDLHEELLLLTRVSEEKNAAFSDSLRKILRDIADVVHRLDVEQNYLDKGIDIYYAAETQVRMQVESLKTSIGSAGFTVTNAATSTGSAVMEDWLAALVLRQGQ